MAASSLGPGLNTAAFSAPTSLSRAVTLSVSSLVLARGGTPGLTADLPAVGLSSL